jgi:DNA-binding NtrC family response regulator
MIETFTESEPKTAGPGPLILVIENDGRLAVALTILIEDWGFTPVTANSVSAAARALGNRMRDVTAIITDYHLDDGFTGINGARALTLAIGRTVPTIVTTGHSVLAEHANAFPVLSKPFDPSILRKWLDEHVEKPERRELDS